MSDTWSARAETRTGIASEYDFVAVRQNGTLESGRVYAGSSSEAVASLSGNGLYPVSIRESRGAALRTLFLGTSGKVSLADAALGLRLLSNLVAAGLPIGKALNAFAKVAPQSWQHSLPAIHDAVSAGNSLGGAIGKSELALPSVVLGIVRSGEVAGQLGPAINRAASVLERSTTARKELVAALTYPLILAMTSLTSASVLVLVVLPKFSELLRDMGQSLPRSTELLLRIADLMRDVMPILGVCAILAAVSVHRSSRSREGQQRLHAILLVVPALGSVRFLLATARVASALSALLTSGMPIAPALSHAADAANDYELARRLRAVRERVVGGSRLSDAAEGEEALTTSTIQLIRAGEENGRLAELLDHASLIEEQLAASRVKSALRLVEPLMILGFGGLIALIAAALLQAVYSIRPSL